MEEKAPPNNELPQDEKLVEGALHTLKEKLQTKSPDQIKGPIKVLRKQELKEIILAILKQFGKLSNAELIAKITQLELEKNMLENRLRRDFEEKNEELLKTISVLKSDKQYLEQKNRELNEELEKLREAKRRLDAVIAKSDEAIRRVAELEELVASLKANISELQFALDYYDLVDEPDVPKIQNTLASAREKMRTVVEKHGYNSYVDQIVKQAEEYSGKLLTAEANFKVLMEQMMKGRGSIDTIVGIIKAHREINLIQSFARCVELVMDYILCTF